MFIIVNRFDQNPFFVVFENINLGAGEREFSSEDHIMLS